jgi:hypothetical protein
MNYDLRTMCGRSGIRCSLFALFLLACGGCSHTIAVVGYSSREPRADTETGAKHWPESVLHTGWEVDGWLGDECSTKMSAWCDATGAWGFSNDIANRADAHVFTTMMVFGHAENGNFANFVEIARHSTEPVMVKKNGERITTASGFSDVNISQQFDRINAIRPIVVMHGGIDLPLLSGESNTLACTPDSWSRDLPPSTGTAVSKTQ